MPRVKAAKVQISELGQALEMYKLDMDRYPTSSQGLAALVESSDNAKRWNGPYLGKSKVPVDPWQHEYHYVSPGEHGTFDIFSYGADEKEGGEGEDRDVRELGINPCLCGSKARKG